MNKPRYIPTLSSTTKKSLRFRHPCKYCGNHAPFGKGANLRKVLADHDAGRQINPADLGEWTCEMERCKNGANQ